MQDIKTVSRFAVVWGQRSPAWEKVEGSLPTLRAEQLHTARLSRVHADNKEQGHPLAHHCTEAGETRPGAHTRGSSAGSHGLAPSRPGAGDVQVQPVSSLTGVPGPSGFGSLTTEGSS